MNNFSVFLEPDFQNNWSTIQSKQLLNSRNIWRHRSVRMKAAAALLIATNLPAPAVAVTTKDVSFAQTSTKTALECPQQDPSAVDRSEIVAEILSYLLLEKGWDGGDNDLAPSPEAASQAIAFVEQLPSFASTPEPSVASDGEVILFWKSDHLYLDVGFRGKSEFSYFGTASGKKIKGVARFDQMFTSSDELATFLIESAVDAPVYV